MTDNDPGATTTPTTNDNAGANTPETDEPTTTRRATTTRVRTRTRRTAASGASAPATDRGDDTPATKDAPKSKGAPKAKGGQTGTDDAGDARDAKQSSGGSKATRAKATGAQESNAKNDDGGAKDAGDQPADATSGDSDGTASEPGSAAKRRRRRRGGRGRGRRGDGQSGGGPSADASGRDTGSGDGDGQGSEDGQVAADIERGGTRVAAKQQQRSDRGRRAPHRSGGVAEEVRRAMLDGPPRSMLVTQRPDRTQIAVLEGRTVVEHYVTRKEEVTYVGNIYMGRVQNVLPGMEAAFLDIGKGRNGVLYAGEVLYDELDLEEGADHRIENALKPGQKVLVQVTKDPMGTKGPRLTMHLSLAGRYLVLAPNSDLFGISRKLTDKERDRLRRIVKRTKPDEHGVIVRTAAEGATEAQLTADLQRLLAKWDRVAGTAEDAKALDVVYEEPPLVVKVIRDTFGPGFERCVVDDEALYLQVRDYLEEVAPELLTKLELYGAPSRGDDAATPDTTAGDSQAAAEESAEQAADAQADAATGTQAETGGGSAGASSDDDADAAPDADATTPADTAGSADGGGSQPEDRSPAGIDGDPPIPARLTAEELAEAATRREELGGLFEAYDVAEQLRKAMARKVWLPSGGYLIIETTEAMKVIDVNTGKFTGDGDTNLEEVVLKTNLEAADEIVHQLRLRDMGGIIIIDFIDMLLKANQDQVVRRLKRELLRDRTKTRVSEVSRLGLVQMTRKNVSQGLIESFSHQCESCEGRGIISELD